MRHGNDDDAAAATGSPPPFYELGELASGADCCEWVGRIDAAMGPHSVPGVSELRGGLSDRARAAVEADAGAVAWLRAVAGLDLLRVGGEGGLVDVDVVVSDRWFLMRYDDGDEGMSAHMDGTVRLGDGGGCRSAATLLLYLDDGFAGGRTLFLHGVEPRWSYDPDPERDAARPRPDAAAVAPRAGQAVLIRQDAWHAAERVAGGHKHLLRTDVGVRRGSKRA